MTSSIKILFESAETNGFVEINEETLYTIWEEISFGFIGTDSELARYEFINNFKQAVDSHSAEVLYFKSSGWKINIKKAIIKNVVLAPVLAGVMHLLGFTEDLHPSVIAVLLANIFDADNIEIEEVELDKRDLAIHKILLKVKIKKRFKKYKSVKQWYLALPPEIQKQIFELDFYNFMDKLAKAGFAIEDSGKYKVLKGKNGIALEIN